MEAQPRPLWKADQAEGGVELIGIQLMKSSREHHVREKLVGNVCGVVRVFVQVGDAVLDDDGDD